MTDALKIWDELIKTIQALTTWPIIVLCIVLIFRQVLTTQIPGIFQAFERLIDRIVTLKYKGIEADLKMQAIHKFAASHSAGLTQQVLLSIDGITPHSAAHHPTKSAFAPAVALTTLSPEQQTVLAALSGESAQGKTVAEISRATHQSAATVDTILTELLEQDRIQSAFSSDKNIVFGLHS